MKKYVLITCIFTCTLFLKNAAFGQNLGLSFSPTQYSTKNATQSNLSFSNIENRNSLDFNGYFMQQFTETIGLSAGFSASSRISDMSFNFSQAKVSETFYSVPVKIIFTPSTSFNKTKIFLGFGVNLATVYEQKLVFPNNITIPSDFNTEYGFGSYSKIGLITEMGLRREISEGFYSFVSIGSTYETEKISFNKNGNPANFFNSLSINLGIETRIFQKKDK